MMPSKELVRKVVFREDVFSYENLDTHRGFAITYDECGFGKYMSYFELAHKCKEWAFSKGYELFSRVMSNDHQPFGNCVVYRVEADPEESLHIANENTEPEAIFKACEWIMEQTK